MILHVISVGLVLQVSLCKGFEHPVLSDFPVGRLSELWQRAATFFVVFIRAKRYVVVKVFMIANFIYLINFQSYNSKSNQESLICQGFFYKFVNLANLSYSKREAIY
jgi:hypothetical protein